MAHQHRFLNPQIIHKRNDILTQRLYTLHITMHRRTSSRTRRIESDALEICFCKGGEEGGVVVLGGAETVYTTTPLENEGRC